MANKTLHQFDLKAQPVAADEIYFASAADSFAERRGTVAALLTSQTLLNCTLTNPTLTTPTLGVASATSINGLAITSSTGTLTIAAGKTLTVSNSITLAGTDARIYTLPTTSSTIARTDAAQTFAGVQTFSDTIAGVALTASSTIIQTSASAAALVSGPAGNTNPVFRTVNNIASQATGISITGRAAAAGADITVLSSGTDENLVINAKGAGTISLNPTGTGNIVLGRAATTAFAITQTSAAASAFSSGLNGDTNPVFRLVNNVASQATGISITGRAAAAGADITVLSSGTNENLRLEAKGSGVILLNETATGAVLVGDATNPAFSVVHTTEGTGISVTSAAAAGGVALAAISSGTDENLVINAKGAGTISLNPTGTGNIVLGRAATGVSLAVTGLVKSSSPTAGIGYATGAGAAVTQITSAATGVEINTICGQITTVALTTAGGAEEIFIVTNSAVAATDVVVVSTTYNGAGTPLVGVQAVGAGSFKLVIANLAASSFNAVMVINFTIIKAVAA